MNNVRLLIGGKSVSAKDGGSFQRMNPITRRVVSDAAAARIADVHAAVEAAAQAFPTWAATGPGQRRNLLLGAAEAHARLRGVAQYKTYCSKVYRPKDANA